MTCEFCAIVKGEYESEIVFEDDTLLGVVHLKPASPGHLLLFTKEHYPILEEVPDNLVGHIFSTASVLSTAVFEGLGAQGTNIIIENGVAAGQSIAHFVVHIIPRREKDGLSLEWNPIQASAEEMDKAATTIKDALSSGGKEQKKGANPQKDHSGASDYRIKHLRRIP